MAIDFTLSDSQQELQKNAQGFAEGVLRPVAETIDGDVPPVPVLLKQAANVQKGAGDPLREEVPGAVAAATRGAMSASRVRCPSGLMPPRT